MQLLFVQGSCACCVRCSIAWPRSSGCLASSDTSSTSHVRVHFWFSNCWLELRISCCRSQSAPCCNPEDADRCVWRCSFVLSVVWLETDLLTPGGSAVGSLAGPDGSNNHLQQQVMALPLLPPLLLLFCCELLLLMLLMVAGCFAQHAEASCLWRQCCTTEG